MVRNPFDKSVNVGESMQIICKPALEKCIQTVCECIFEFDNQENNDKK